MSEAATWKAEFAAHSACRLKVEGHMRVPHSLNCLLKDFFCFLMNHRSSASRIHLRSCFTTTGVEGKDASTTEFPLNSSESIIDAICSQTRGSFSIS